MNLRIKEFRDAQVKKAVGILAEGALLKTGFQIEKLAKQLCPVDTGRLRASISTNWFGGPQNTALAVAGKRKGKSKKSAPQTADSGIAPPMTPLTVHVGTNVFYGRLLEFGTVRMRARPFLIPALNAVLRYSVYWKRIK